MYQGFLQCFILKQIFLINDKTFHTGCPRFPYFDKKNLYILLLILFREVIDEFQVRSKQRDLLVLIRVYIFVFCFDFF